MRAYNDRCGTTHGVATPQVKRIVTPAHFLVCGAVRDGPARSSKRGSAVSPAATHVNSLSDALRSLITYAYSVRVEPDPDGTFLEKTSHFLHVVDQLTRPGTFDAPGGDVVSLLLRIRDAAFAIGSYRVGLMADGVFATHCDSLHAALAALDALGPFVQEPAPIAVPALSNGSADSPAEPDGPTLRGGFRWRGVSCDGIGQKQRALLLSLWDAATGSPRESVPMVDVVRAVYGAGASVGKRYRALMGVRARLDTALADSKLRIEVRVVNGRLWLSPLGD